MLFVFGLIVVFTSVISGYLMHHGKLEVLWQPHEYVIIIGAAIGSFIIGNPRKIVIGVLKSFKYLFKGTPFNKNDYVDLMILLSQVFKLMRSKGMLELESHIENPFNSSIFSQHRSFLRNKHAVTFFCDYLRILTMGVDDHMQIEDLMDQDLETHHKEHEDISHAVLMMGDAMPALGIVAAVLGVIITMRSITEPPEILGMLIGSALVGTFLGVLISYTLVSPMGRFMGAYYQAEDKYLECIKCALLSHMKGNAPAISIEFARNNIPPKERPDFFEVENAVSNAGTGASA